MPSEVDASGTDEHQVENKTPLRQKLSCAAGHVLNDLFIQMAVSFQLVYYIKVAGLPGGQAGWIMLVALVATAFAAPLAGYCSDRIAIPLISRAVGKRKAWHLIGVILMTIFFPLLFTRCLICHDTSPQWVKLAYYMTIVTLINSTAFPNLDIGHLSIISVVAKNHEESVELYVLR